MNPKLFLLLACGILCTSCTSLFHGRTTHLTIRTSEPAIVTLGERKTATIEKEISVPGEATAVQAHIAGIELPDNEPISLTIESEYPTRQIEISPHSCYIDLQSGGIERLRGRKNTAWLHRTEKERMWDNLNRKGLFSLTLGMPIVNTSLTYIEKAGRNDTNTGFWGISVGADYHYAPTRSLALDVSNTSNLFAVIYPAWAFGIERRQASVHASISDNIHSRRFSFGYGINLTYNWWIYDFDAEDYHEDEIPKFGREDIRQSHTGIGPLVNFYWKATPSLRLGLTYRTSLYRFDASSDWKYEHAIGIDFKYHLRLSRKR